MSETEVLVGRLYPIEIINNIENTCKLILTNNNWKIAEWHDNYREALEDKGYEKFYITDNSIFKIEMIYSDPYDDIFHSVKNEDGTYDFILKYYNGGCGFDEAMDAAMEDRNL